MSLDFEATLKVHRKTWREGSGKSSKRGAKGLGQIKTRASAVTLVS